MYTSVHSDVAWESFVYQIKQAHTFIQVKIFDLVITASWLFI